MERETIMNVNFVVKNGLIVRTDAVINSTTDTTSNTTGALKVSGGVGITKKVKVGTTATDSRFPNTTVAISNSSSATTEGHNIGLLAEGTADSANTAVYGVGVYGVGYTSGGTRSGGVIGEGHVTASIDTGSAIGVRGYSNDTHTGGMNIGLYGDASNGANNYALYLNNGNVYSNYALTWTLNGNLTFAGAYSVTIPSLSLTNALPVTSGGTGVTTKTGTGSVVLNTDPTIITSLTTTSTSFDLINTNALAVQFAGSATSITIGSSTGTTTINHNLQVEGNITYGGSANQLSATNLSVDDALIYIGAHNPADIVDLGIIGAYNNYNDSTPHPHTGLVRDASDKIWKLFSGVTEEPGTSVNFDAIDIVYDDLKIGNLISNSVNKVSITAPDSTATLTLANGSSLITAGANTLTLTTTGTTNVTLPTSGTLVNSTVTALNSLSSVGTITTGTWSGSFGAVSGANLTSLTAGNLTGTIPSAVLGNSSIYIGNTAVALNKSAGSLTVSGLNTDGYAGALKSTSTVIDVASAEPPTNGQVLVATGPSAAMWKSLPTGTGTVTSVSGSGTVNGISLTGSVTSTGSLTLGGTLSGVSLTSQVTGTLPVSNGGTGVTTSSGTGSVVLTNSPLLVTPSLGVATATSINKLTLTTPTTGATLTLADNSSLITVGGYSTTLTTTGITNVTLPTSGTLVNSAVTSLGSLATVGTITTGIWSGSFGAVTGENLTNLTAGNLSGTIPSAVLANSTHYIGTTAVALNRASGSLNLTGVNIDGYSQSLKSATTTVNVSAADEPSAYQVLMATSSTSATWQNVSMAHVSGTLSVANGGTGAITLTGILKGNGTGAFTVATAGTDYVAPSGALGTPTAGTLTNCTGYTFANLASKPTTLSGYGITDAVASSLIGASSGIAPLGSDSKIASTYLPSYVDDVLEYTDLAGMPVTGETGKIYVALDTNKIYRWSGSTYIEISPTAGNADTATKLLTSRSIAASGDANWTVNFDGSANATAVLTLANIVTAGTGTKLTYNAKGLITGSSSLTVSDITDISTNYQAKNSNLTSIAGLSVSSTGLVKLSNGVASLDTNTYVVYGGALDTPTSGTLTNCSGLPLSTGVSGTLSSSNGGTGSTTLTFPSGTASIGYLDIPQVSQSANYTCVLSDSGKHIYHPGADTTARTFTIPANASVAYPVGTAIMFVNDSSAGVVTIAIDSDTLVLAGAGTTGSRSLAASGIATAIKMTSTRWMISGTNLT